MTTGLRWMEPKGDARSWEEDPAGSARMILRLGPAEISALRHAVAMYLFFEVTGDGRSVLEDLYALFASWKHDPG